MNFNLDELVTPCVIDKLAEIYENDETYQKLLKEEDLIYEKLLDELPDEQAEELEKYFEATVSTSSRRDALTYVQGMKDMYNLFMTLQEKEDRV